VTILLFDLISITIPVLIDDHSLVCVTIFDTDDWAAIQAVIHWYLRIRLREGGSASGASGDT